MMALQESTFADGDYQVWRKELAETCHGQVANLKRDLIAVKMRLRYVEKYQKEDQALTTCSA